MSNHLGNTNKMVSDTPRTDSCLIAILDADGYVDQRNCPKLWVSHSRELERELNAANESFRKLNIHTLNLVDRISRLEEAGDAMMSEPCEYTFERWIKAKEVKP